MKKNTKIQFPSRDQNFYNTLKKRANAYFKSASSTRHANSEMVFKTIFMFSLYLVPVLLLYTGAVQTGWLAMALCMLMGVGIAGIGLSVMHDANHGAYSNRKWVNNLLGYSLNLIGGNAFNWQIQHNVLHHTYTNIYDVDEDISPRGILRMTPHSEWKSFHRFQFVYAWFVYGFMTLAWVFAKDFNRLIRYQKNGLIRKHHTTEGKEWSILLVTKALYLSYTLILPMVFLPFTWWQVCIGFFAMHFVAGFILAIIFQPAHVVEGTEFPMPDDSGNMQNTWALHQVATTSNFANNSRLFSWYVGGLNFQIEHHLFPNVCHVHYRHLASIVRSTAEEFNVPYRTLPTFLQALLGHGRLLWDLGRRPVKAEGTAN
ncbi:MAG: acyl-CoA desaturase [Cyclobacteriaceae bacterium]|nr:acyl-CoA desaturase [Cyclobacteriaceae bacterium]